MDYNSPCKKPVGSHPAPMVVSYKRFSSPSQSKGRSIGRQTEPTLEWSKKHDIVYDPRSNYDDRGVSAFRGKNADVGRLAELIELAKTGKVIWPGCYLAIENLDRLSRNKVLTKGLPILQDLLAAGIRIVTHTPQRIYTKDSTQFEVMEMLMILMRAREESETKSKRSCDNWQTKRKHAKTQKMTSVCPAWMRPVRNDANQCVGFELIPERVKVLETIHELFVEEGLGRYAISQFLMEEGTPTFTGKERWEPSVIKAYLTSPALIGQMQPTEQKELPDDTWTRVPSGPPVENYYPAVLTKKQYAAALEVAAANRAAAGKREQRARCLSVFGKLLRDCRSGLSMQVVDNTASQSGVRIKPRPAKGVRSRPTFDNTLFETAAFKLLADLPLAMIAPSSEEQARFSDQMSAALKAVTKAENKMAVAEAAFDGWNGEGDGKLLGRKMRQAEEDHTEAVENLRALQRIQETPATRMFSECKQVIDALLTPGCKDSMRLRVKLKRLLPRFISRIDVMIWRVNRQNERALIADIHFATGKVERLEIVSGDFTIPAEVSALKLDAFDRWSPEHQQGHFTSLTKREQDMVGMWHDGIHMREIAKHFNIGQCTMYAVLRSLGIDTGTRRQMFDDIPQGTRAKAVKLHQQGETISAIGRTLGLSRGHVAKIVKNGKGGRRKSA